MTDRPITDILDSIAGLGAAKRQTILAAYPSTDDLAAATVDDLTGLDGIGKTLARKIVHAGTVVDEPTEVTSLRHAERRKNIPTDEHAHLVDTTGNGEADTRLYDRDPDLDPQLVWRGKDTEDRTGLAVPVVPIYIQEKVDPRIIVENLRNTAGDDADEPELTLFDDFDGIDDPMAAIEFYEHDANWSNRMILGDALVGMTSLAEKEDLKGKVQTIYLDPPYGVKFQSNWQVSTRNRKVADGKDLTSQPEQVRAFRDTWKYGVNSYLSYLRDRLLASRQLLNETGSIFVQIGDDNVHVVRNLLDEIFGPQNYVSLITYQKTSGARTKRLANVADFILWYAKDREKMKFRKLYREQRIGSPGTSNYTRIKRADGSTRSLSALEKAGVENVPAGERAFTTSDLTSQSPGSRYPVQFDGQEYNVERDYWKTSPEGMERLKLAGRVYGTETRLYYIRYLDDFNLDPLNNVWTDAVSSFMDDKIYVVQTNPDVVERCVLMTSDPGDLVLDPTCGSGTTAFVAEKWGRRWITIDTSRVALALARQRIMGARYPYFVLSDTAEGAVAEARESGQEVPTPEGGWRGDIRRGFVYKRALHVMLSTIANCEELRPGMSPDDIDVAIRRAADSEFLYDQPIENKDVVRVAGPFTVESLSPHRTASTDAAAPGTGGDFVELVLDNLQRTGVQNGYRDGRLDLGWLDPRAGTWVHAVGGFTDEDGNDHTVAISVGPEAGTVGREHVAEAAKEALRDVRADLLLVCAYAFDAGAGEQANAETDAEQTFTVDGQRQVGKLRVLNVRINTDLMMGDELKATGAGNLFMVFGEPDVGIVDNGDDTLTVTLKGLDIYDPNKGTIRSTQPSEIACWFIDTSYNGESFFVRHAYFTGGGNDPFDALKKALRSEIDREAWSALYRTESMPFPRPPTGKIAVKAINHFGDEAMRVFSVT